MLGKGATPRQTGEDADLATPDRQEGASTCCAYRQFEKQRGTFLCTSVHVQKFLNCGTQWKTHTSWLRKAGRINAT